MVSCACAVTTYVSMLGSVPVGPAYGVKQGGKADQNGSREARFTFFILRKIRSWSL